MKELIIKSKDTIESVAQKQVKKEVRLIGSQRVIPGLTLWQFNVETKALAKAKFKNVNYVLNGGKRYDVIIEENCIYFQALNRKNALKKINRVAL